MSDIGATVLGIPTRNDEYLLQRRFDASGDPVSRPIDGGIGFGEASGPALEREYREELDLAVSVGPTPGTVENRFRRSGDLEHEFVVVRTAGFDGATVAGVERGGDQSHSGSRFSRNASTPSSCSGEL